MIPSGASKNYQLLVDSASVTQQIVQAGFGERGVYHALPQRFTVIRYHSLVIEQASLPQVLDVTCTSEDGEIMGVRHRELAGTKTPLEGVQFHPESILTEHGHAMLKNFLDLRA